MDVPKMRVATTHCDPTTMGNGRTIPNTGTPLWGGPRSHLERKVEVKGSDWSLEEYFDNWENLS